MGNGLMKLNLCFAGDCEESSRRRKDIAGADLSDTLDEGLGHSFVYMKPDTSSRTHLFSTDSCSSTTTTASSMTTAFYTISGASISANTSTPLSTALFDLGIEKASAFESSRLFSSIPLQPVPRSGPLHRVSGIGSGPISGGFLSAPIPETQYDQAAHRHKPKSKKWNFLRNLKKIIPIDFKLEKETKNRYGIDTPRSQTGEEDDGDLGMASPSSRGENVQWAQGKAGEDRVHVVISEEHDLVFVGIYDGFNGPDATDFLLQNLYTNVFREVKGESADVLNAMAEGLKKTEADYLNITDLMLNENPELALMGSCVLAMLMKGQDVFLMNVGDSRAVLARVPRECHGNGRPRASHDLYKTMSDLKHNLVSHQLTVDHTTSSKEEAKRIKREHPNDSSAIKNDRVKGSLKVTRAFGAAYLKHRKWNDAVLEAFRVEYKGNSPYINCTPSLHHHKLCPRDKFLILSSDGLYQYFTNSEAVSEVETFMSIFPDGDPAQHLVEEVVFRAAKQAGMDFHELLDIPQGERRMYHDDVSIIVISFEGKLWQSSM
ncbi:unnamed protein product [Cuscuta campestris]|uniref:PPM-type phosphatase domain-containing protein n=1 Tax=Cuscuta campestris TaxID=132261 RepID=A0A484MK93_9ASTE|nr:unnamed protein product [Cuscuta campestris]